MLKFYGISRIFILPLLFISTSAFAAFLDLPVKFRTECLKAYEGRHYIHPNETRPHRAKPILEKAPQGAYVSVGTERGIFGAIQAPRITHLIMVDMDPMVCAFNNINFALIKLSKGNRTDFQYLRQKASFQDWRKQIINNPDILSSEEKEFLTYDLYHLWKSVIDTPRIGVDFEKGEFEDHFIGGVHYIFNDQAFQRIYRLVAGNKVEAIYLNLKDKVALSELGKAMKKIGLALAVLDISNAWHEAYMKREGVRELAEWGKEFFLLQPDSYILGSGSEFLLADGSPNLFNESSGGCVFARYSAFTFNYFEKNPHPFSIVGDETFAYDGQIDQEENPDHPCDKLLDPSKRPSSEGF